MYFDQKKALSTETRICINTPKEVMLCKKLYWLKSIIRMKKAMFKRKRAPKNSFFAYNKPYTASITSRSAFAAAAGSSAP